jgi:fucose permease
MKNPRTAITALFFVNGAIFSSFFARLPAIKAGLDASDGQLGVALLLATTGLVAAQPLAGALIARRGVLAPALGGALAYAAGLPLAAAAPSVVTLALVLFAMGVANGLLDVAINVEGVAIERRRGRRMLASMHAAFSFGAMAGAGLGGLAAGAGLDPLPHLGLVAVAAGAVVAAASQGLPRVTPEGERPRAFARPSWGLAALGACAFCVLLAEGSVTDWSAVFLNGVAGAGEGLAAAGLTVFSLSMAGSRLAGDRLAERFGPIRVLAAGGLLAAAALGAGLAAAQPAAGIAGFAVMGLGLGATFPLIVTVAARDAGGDEAQTIAAVSGMGYVGLMTGPALIGLLSDAAGLRQALLLVVALCVAAAALSRSVRPAPVGAAASA